MINLKSFFVIFVILVIDLSILVECQQRLGVGNKRLYSASSYQGQYRPQYSYQNGYNNQWPQGFNNQWQRPQGFNYQWQKPQGFNNQWQWPQGSNNQWQWPQNQWGQNQWGSNQWNPSQWPQYQNNFPNFLKPLGGVFDIIKQSQQFFPKNTGIMTT